MARGPWSVNPVDFQQHCLFSLCPHIAVPIFASQIKRSPSVPPSFSRPFRKTVNRLGVHGYTNIAWTVVWTRLSTIIVWTGFSTTDALAANKNGSLRKV